MPVKINSAFTPTSEIGAALNNAITGYVNNMPTYGERQEARVNQNKADSPQAIADAIRAMYGNSSQPGQKLTPAMVQDGVAGLAQATAMGGDVGKLGDLMRTAIYNSASPENTKMKDNAYMGAGGNYAATETGFNIGQANDLEKVRIQQAGANRRAAMSPRPGGVGPDGKPVLTAAQQMAAEKQRRSQVELDRQLDELDSLYKQLEDQGAAVSSDNDYVTNKLNQISASGIGQAIGQGGPSQSLRNNIEAIRQGLRINIMAASGLGSKVFDSNKDLEALLKTVTSPGMDVQANRNIIRNLKMQYGAGGAAIPNLSSGSGVVDTPKTPTAKHVQDLVADPSLAQEFDEFYGPGMADRYLSMANGGR